MMKNKYLILGTTVFLGLTVAGIKASAVTTSAPHIVYDTQVQRIGWQKDPNNRSTWFKDGDEAGTNGKSLRMESIKIALQLPAGLTGGIEYDTHVQTYGWQNAANPYAQFPPIQSIKPESEWFKNGQTAGTVGQAKRMEAFTVKLTGQVAQYYDVIYDSHVQNIGWQYANHGTTTGENPTTLYYHDKNFEEPAPQADWFSNGLEVGTNDHALRMEALKIKLVAKTKKVSKTITRTLDFVDVSGKSLKQAVVQKVTFTGIQNIVTGATTWQKSSAQFAAVTSPTVTNYAANLVKIPTLAVTPSSKNTTVKVIYSSVIPFTASAYDANKKLLTNTSVKIYEGKNLFTTVKTDANGYLYTYLTVGHTYNFKNSAATLNVSVKANAVNNFTVTAVKGSLDDTLTLSDKNAPSSVKSSVTLAPSAISLNTAKVNYSLSNKNKTITVPSSANLKVGDAVYVEASATNPNGLGLVVQSIANVSGKQVAQVVPVTSPAQVFSSLNNKLTNAPIASAQFIPATGVTVDSMRELKTLAPASLTTTNEGNVNIGWTNLTADGKAGATLESKVTAQIGGYKVPITFTLAGSLSESIDVAYWPSPHVNALSINPSISADMVSKLTWSKGFNQKYLLGEARIQEGATPFELDIPLYLVVDVNGSASITAEVKFASSPALKYPTGASNLSPSFEASLNGTAQANLKAGAELDVRESVLGQFTLIGLNFQAGMQDTASGDVAIDYSSAKGFKASASGENTLNGYVTGTAQLLDNTKFSAGPVTVNLNLEKDFSLFNKTWLIWTNKAYQVSFNSNGGSSVAAQKVVTGKTAKAPTAPTKAGYSFAGWYTDTAGKNKYNFSQVVTKDLTLYAKWEKVETSMNLAQIASGDYSSIKGVWTDNSHDVIIVDNNSINIDWIKSSYNGSYGTEDYQFENTPYDTSKISFLNNTLESVFSWTDFSPSPLVGYLDYFPSGTMLPLTSGYTLKSGNTPSDITKNRLYFLTDAWNQNGNLYSSSNPEGGLFYKAVGDKAATYNQNLADLLAASLGMPYALETGMPIYGKVGVYFTAHYIYLSDWSAGAGGWGDHTTRVLRNADGTYTVQSMNWLASDDADTNNLNVTWTNSQTVYSLSQLQTKFGNQAAKIDSYVKNAAIGRTEEDLILAP